MVLGLAGLAFAAPAEADELACALIADATAHAERRGLALDACEAVADLRREEAAPLLPRAPRSRTRGCARSSPANRDPTTTAGGRCCTRSTPSSAPARASTRASGADVARARRARRRRHPAALRAGREAVDEIAAAADWLERATDDDPIDRRHSMRLLRELDRELLGDNTLGAVLALAPDTDPARAQLARALGAIEAALLAREATPRPARSRMAACGSRGCARSSACSTACAPPATPTSARASPRSAS